ncbi:MAG TPA: hypothetical protein VLA19_10775 [Herpetosiphonaceae bacterium]|nr:hypothetical protein [Herpetosiphonaceae bacterium]
MVVAARQRGAHVLSRLPGGVKPQPLRTLPYGSFLAALLPSEDGRRRRGERSLVRIITYTITDPTLPDYGEEHRVLTTLLNPQRAPANALACACHERWEIEVVIDEIDTHQRLVGRPQRSLTPAGVIQELYGVLLAHYAVRVLMHEAALQAEVDPDRLSFVHALEVVRDAVAEFQMVAEGQQRALYARLLQDIAAKRLPARRVRSNARVVKRKGIVNLSAKRDGDLYSGDDDAEDLLVRYLSTQPSGGCLPHSRPEIDAHVPCGTLPLVIDADVGRNVPGSAQRQRGSAGHGPET